MPRGSFPNYLYNNCSLFRLVALTVLLTIVWNEYVSYMLMPFSWGQLPAEASDPDEEIRILFVADPQLIGYQDDPESYSKYSRWDSDRYVRRTFQLVFGYFRPDVIVYMGDLLDEGSKATDQQYSDYMDRFHDIFAVAKDTPKVYISGDNDVGGEGFERKEEWKVQNFNKHFLNCADCAPSVVKVKFIDFLRLELSPDEVVAENIRNQLRDMSALTSAKYKIVLNHCSILTRFSNDQEDIVQITQANFIFSAHSHYSRQYTCLSGCGGGQRPLQIPTMPPGVQRLEHLEAAYMRYLQDSDVHAFSLNEDSGISELGVPTCSYRMGVPRMGYGAAVISSQGAMQYTVLWSPARYGQLYAYVYMLCTCTALCAFKGLVIAVSYIRDPLLNSLSTWNIC